MITSMTYLIYIAISIGITIYVSRTLSKNGEVYLIDGFNGNVELARSVNHMLVVGFYLLNIGFVLIRLQSNRIIDFETMIIYLSSNIGLVLVILGAFHFLNMMVVHKIRSEGMKKAASNRSLHETAKAAMQSEA
jgi:hypothetical protein